jgi:hypothetical protein
MTELEARNYLNDLWQNGEIPDNFTDGHSDYDKAVNHTMKNDQFDYERFYEEISIIKFGMWQVESDALVAKEGHDYIIDCGRFWETRNYDGHLTWDWLIHLADKGWINKKNVKDLNTAFFFCQDYFKENKPTNLPYVSTAQTLFIQKQLLDIREEMSKYEKTDKRGMAIADTESFLKYGELMDNIKFL